MKVFASFFKKKRLFFFEKKNQKTFVRLTCGSSSRCWAYRREGFSDAVGYANLLLSLMFVIVDQKMRRSHFRMMMFGLAFVAVAGIGMFGTVLAVGY